MKLKFLPYSLFISTFIFAGAFYSQQAKAQHSVQTCTNSCVITYENGTVSVRDCCGGQVITTWPPHDERREQ